MGNRAHPHTVTARPRGDVTGSRSGGQMKQLQHQLVRFFVFTILAMAVACGLAYLLLLSGGDHPYLIACVAAAIGAALLAFAGRPRGEAGLKIGRAHV